MKMLPKRFVRGYLFWLNSCDITSLYFFVLINSLLAFHFSGFQNWGIMLPGFQLFLLEQNLVRLSLWPPLNHDGVSKFVFPSWLDFTRKATVIGLLRQIKWTNHCPLPLINYARHIVALITAQHITSFPFHTASFILVCVINFDMLLLSITCCCTDWCVLVGDFLFNDFWECLAVIILACCL
jgi:hypothetical protein